jgi:hypothetical protein
MDYQKSNTVLSMVLGAGFGLVACAISFSVVGTISAMAWIELIPPRLPPNSLINFVFVESPIQIGTVPGAIFGTIFGTFWGVFDPQVGGFVLRLLHREFDLGSVLCRTILVVISGSIILGLVGVFVTASLWQI